eukprot:GHVN01004398.1.p1 GENE.GHVN01004398.1~~GHVN01004398.1.p1  ORF type:complete len:359 (+),score=120.97 GHVN01004398.1:229-1305(+)
MSTVSKAPSRSSVLYSAPNPNTVVLLVQDQTKSEAGDDSALPQQKISGAKRGHRLGAAPSPDLPREQHISYNDPNPNFPVLDTGRTAHQHNHMGGRACEVCAEAKRIHVEEERKLNSIKLVDVTEVFDAMNEEGEEEGKSNSGDGSSWGGNDESEREAAQREKEKEREQDERQKKEQEEREAKEKEQAEEKRLEEERLQKEKEETEREEKEREEKEREEKEREEKEQQEKGKADAEAPSTPVTGGGGESSEEDKTPPSPGDTEIPVPEKDEIPQPGEEPPVLVPETYNDDLDQTKGMDSTRDTTDLFSLAAQPGGASQSQDDHMSLGSFDRKINEMMANVENNNEGIFARNDNYGEFT